MTDVIEDLIELARKHSGAQSLVEGLNRAIVEIRGSRAMLGDVRRSLGVDAKDPKPPGFRGDYSDA
jgi:hypothetical protein